MENLNVMDAIHRIAEMCFKRETHTDRAGQVRTLTDFSYNPINEKWMIDGDYIEEVADALNIDHDALYDNHITPRQGWIIITDLVDEINAGKF